MLICDYETNQRTVTRHIHKIRAGLGIETGSNILYRKMGQPLASEIESVQAQVLEHGVQLVIIDSAAPAVGSGGAQSDEPVLKYFGALRNLDITTLTIAHRAKNSDNGPFGSVFFSNIAHNVYRLQSRRGGAKGYTWASSTRRRTTSNGHPLASVWTSQTTGSRSQRKTPKHDRRCASTYLYQTRLRRL